jgi:uncharacterized integral membrane protein (TIGR00697 family)
MNNFLFLITILANFFGIIVAFRLFGKVGLYGWAVMATIVANIEVAKCVDMLGLSVTLGNVIYGSVFLCTDILSEMYGERDAKRCVSVTFLFMVIATVLFQASLLFIPNENDFISPAMKEVFAFVPRLAASSIACFWISNRIDVFLYQWIRKRFKPLWLRNNGATMVAQLLDSVLFTFAAFAGVFDLVTLIEISFTTYAIKVFVAVCDTPFLYWAKSLYNRGRIPA